MNLHASSLYQALRGAGVLTEEDSEVARPGWDAYFLDIARAVSSRASCRRRKVGAVLVDSRHRIIATGYNGAPSGLPDCLEGACPRGLLSYAEVSEFSHYDDPESPGFCIAVHAEENALLHAPRIETGVFCYVTAKPCPHCMRALAAARVDMVVYRDDEGLLCRVSPSRAVRREP